MGKIEILAIVVVSIIAVIMLVAGGSGGFFSFGEFNRFSPAEAPAAPAPVSAPAPAPAATAPAPAAPAPAPAAPVQEEEALPGRNHEQMILETLYLYYTSYINCLNQQSQSGLQRVADGYDISFWINRNLNNEFSFTSVIADLGSLVFYSDVGAEIRTQYQYQWRQRNSNAAWRDIRSTQSCSLEYDAFRDVWIIKSIDILDDSTTLGGNQIILNPQTIDFHLTD